VFVSDASERGPALARASIPKRRFEALFAKELAREKERGALATVPLDERAKYLVTRFGIFDGAVTSEHATRELVGMGPDAVPALIDALSSKEHGWQAAMTLAQIGSAAEPAAPALLRHASAGDSSPRAMWCARALGRLGKIETLIELAGQDATMSCAVEGLVAARPASYEPINALLDRRNTKIQSLFARALEPGSADYEKAPHYFDAIAQALDGPHAIVRADAVSALGDSALGEANRARAVPLLARALKDESSEVRRLAALSLGWCGRHARAQRESIEALLTDKRESVRQAAEVALAHVDRRR
jgi:HEAT repeat protein